MHEHAVDNPHELRQCDLMIYHPRDRVEHPELATRQPPQFRPGIKYTDHVRLLEVLCTSLKSHRESRHLPASPAPCFPFGASETLSRYTAPMFHATRNSPVFRNPHLNSAAVSLTRWILDIINIHNCIMETTLH